MHKEKLLFSGGLPGVYPRHPEGSCPPAALRCLYINQIIFSGLDIRGVSTVPAGPAMGIQRAAKHISVKVDLTITALSVDPS